MEIPEDLRARLEEARLDVLALLRALDRMNFSAQEIPQRLLRQLFELDADFVEALWGLDLPAGALNLQAMVRDTLASLEQLPTASSRLRRNLPSQNIAPLTRLERAVRSSINPAEAYRMVPGRDPQNR